MTIKKWWILVLSLFMSQVFAEEKVISSKEIQSHNSVTDCWIIVNANVYDITKYIKTHDKKCADTNLIDLCGKDASVKWQSKQNSKHAHKRKSVLEFERSRIGRLLKS